ncbi:hypothetical protein Mycch_1322 [Mycolicibacterium chubuense NBB4]|uniref:Uncharacterized protein n=1 Tax=Mycolicibacterium chubuense (strain NBB4) TaxID=710421 RepID=I4BFR7_MYCCN|nr:hypothetical protein [Mycolicibacterium chubuense]AFM16124.1 hypothetical protein Mycch_1322 [Mycolicibacterium chubuense NBB4]
MLMWVLVAVGGAAGSALGLLLMRRPSTTRLMTATAAVCGLMGAFSVQLHSPELTAVLKYGVLGTAASMLAVGVTSRTWIGGDAPLRSALAVARNLAVYCVVAVTCTLLGYLALRSGFTLYKKFG